MPLGDDLVRVAGADAFIEVIAGEQSSGTFLALANETPALKTRSGARVERLEVRFPDGSVVRRRGVAADRLVVVERSP